MFTESRGIQSDHNFSTSKYILLSDDDLLLIKTKAKFKFKINTIQFSVHFAYRAALSPNFKLALHTAPDAAYILSGQTEDKLTVLTLDGTSTEGETISQDILRQKRS